MRISDWSSDVCSSDLVATAGPAERHPDAAHRRQHGGGAGTDRPGGGEEARRLQRRGQYDRRGGVSAGTASDQIGRETSRESVCQYVWISVVAVTLKKKNLK